MNKDVISVFVGRLNRIGIQVELIGNYPWIYLNTVNGNRVKERFLGNHGFTVAWYPVKSGEKIKLTDISEIFRIIRKYR